LPHLLPNRQILIRLALRRHLLAQIQFAATGINIHILEVDAEGPFAVPQLVANEEENDDEGCEVGLEESFRVEVGASDGLDGLLVLFPKLMPNKDKREGRD
jgi:sensor domain CHASE-containing protein